MTPPVVKPHIKLINGEWMPTVPRALNCIEVAYDSRWGKAASFCAMLDQRQGRGHFAGPAGLTAPLTRQ